jgi:ATP-binding cassette subfamily B protein
MKITRTKNIFDNIIYMLKNWWSWDKKGLLICSLRIPILIFTPILTACIPKVLIDCIQNNVPINELVFKTGIVSSLVAILSWINPFLLEISHSVGQNIRMKYRILAFEKMLNIDYYNWEKYDVRLKFERGKEFAFGGRKSGSENFLYVLLDFLTAFLALFTYIFLVNQLNPILLYIILVTCVVELYSINQINTYEHLHRDNEVSGWYKLAYLFQVSTSIKSGKDIRIYNAKEWFKSIIDATNTRHKEMIKLLINRTVRFCFLQSISIFVREFATYAFLIYNVLKQHISLADFTFYIGIILGFSSWVTGISNQILGINIAVESCEKFRDFLDVQDYQKSSVFMPIPQYIKNISFKNIYFKYEENNKYILNNIDFTINSGEKIAIVGENGAGKTTLIKLLCGLSKPTSGEILINDININSFDREAYYNIISAVFQDYNLLPTSIGANVSISNNWDTNKVKYALEQAGLWERISEFPLQLNTKLNKQLYDEAVELSGGEYQRLLLARALYKNAPILILDEPTSALDPIAERKLYEKYNELTKNKTVFFISHRLASTRFCDRVIYMENGQILEMGTHDELMKNKKDYYNMFKIQSSYYLAEDGEL